MHAYTADEVGCEISEFEVPSMLAATGPGDTTKSVVYVASIIDCINDAHFMGAVEGFIDGWLCSKENDIDAIALDDEEYPAHRIITRHADGTLFMEARFGRNKEWVLAVSREDDAKAKKMVEDWLNTIIRGDEADASAP